MVLLRLELDEPSGKYIAGQRIMGKVHVSVTGSPLKCRGIRLHLFGRGYTLVIKGKTHYKTTAPYFEVFINLFGKLPDHEGENPVLPIGEYSYPFCYQIPAGCPSSYKHPSWGTTAYIKYEATVIVDKPWQFDEKLTREFTVVGLNTSVLSFFTDVLGAIPAMREEKKSKTLGVLCFEGGQISATLRVPAVCYRAGDSVPFYAEIDNESSRTMKRYYISLKRVTTLWAACGEKDTERDVIPGTKEVRQELILPGHTKNWQGTVKIPTEGVDVLGGAGSIISIEYQLVLTVVPKGPSFDLDLPLVLEMGTPVKMRMTTTQ